MRSFIIGALLLLSIAFYPYLKEAVALPAASLVSGQQLKQVAPNQRVCTFATLTEHYVTAEGIRVVKAQTDDGYSFSFTERAQAGTENLRIATRYYVEGTVTNGLFNADGFKAMPPDVKGFTEIRGHAFVMQQTHNGDTLASIEENGTRTQTVALFSRHLRGIPYTQKGGVYRGYYEHGTFIVREVEQL